jgi:hypothetical protein
MRVLRDGVVVAGVGVFVIVGFCGGAIGSVGGNKKAPTAGVAVGAHVFGDFLLSHA